LGLVFLIFGLNYFVPFLPAPPLPEAALPFLGGLASVGYLLPLMKAIEVAAGIALLTNRFVPLALAVLAPIIINIAGFHFTVAPSYGMPIALLVLELYLAWSFRDAFAPMLHAKTVPASASESETAQPAVAIS
jgi:hypothetical protein